MDIFSEIKMHMDDIRFNTSTRMKSVGEKLVNCRELRIFDYNRVNVSKKVNVILFALDTLQYVE